MNYIRRKGKVDWTFVSLWFFILVSLAIFWLAVVAGTFAIMQAFNVI